VNYHEPKGIVASKEKPKFTRLSIEKSILRLLTHDTCG
jgi:hypothetical protein